jgi:hypothetical protein
MQQVPASQLSFEVTFDSPSLHVGMSVYETTTGTPSLVAGPTAMAQVTGNTYFSRFTPTAGKQYVIYKAVYSDSGLTTLDPNYAPGTESIRCDDIPGPKKNTALPAFEFPMTDATTHEPATGLTVTVQRSIDGAAFANCANAAAELASGMYKIDLAAADLNGKVIGLKFTATGADTRFATVFT